MNISNGGGKTNEQEKKQKEPKDLGFGNQNDIGNSSIDYINRRNPKSSYIGERGRNPPNLLQVY